MSLPPLAPKDYGFPDPAEARLDAEGLLAVGGDLQPARLLAAYANGIFPWFNSDRDQILWWCPDPRGIIAPADFAPKRSLRKTLRRSLATTEPNDNAVDHVAGQTKSDRFQFTLDMAFADVIRSCADTPRANQGGTWITDNMQSAYISLHELGFAHSLEVWNAGKLVGGLYGLSLGRMFFGESMFSHRKDASKCAFALLCAQLTLWEFDLLDCQMMNPHLASLGVKEMPRARFLEQLAANDLSQTRRGRWHLEPHLDWQAPKQGVQYG